MAPFEILVVLTDFPGLTEAEKLFLSEKLDNIEDLAVLSSIEGLVSLTGRIPKKQPPERHVLEALIEARIKGMERSGIRFVHFYSDDYPPLLREIYDPPSGLFYRGRLPETGKPLVSVVGTRSPSGDGVSAAFSLSEDLGRHGVSVVSGLAFGIDAFAHRGNISGGGFSVAVLACGVDILYPRGNSCLAGKILESGGCILSEYPPGVPPLKYRFPRRNRIISGIARSVIVVEAPEKSGALITADFALDQGRDMFVYAGTLDSRRNFGGRNLHAQGAPAVSSAFDIFSAWDCSCLLLLIILAVYT